MDASLIVCSSQIKGMEVAFYMGAACTGNTFEVLADRVENLRVPAAKAHYIVLEAIRGANDSNQAALASLPETQSGILDTDYCDALIASIRENSNYLAYREQYYYNMAQGDNYDYYQSLARAARNTITANYQMIAELQAKIDAAYDYSAASSAFYADAMALASSLLEKSTCSITTFLETGSYGDLEWASTMDADYKESFAKQKDRLNREASKEEGVIGISDDGTKVFIGGEAYDLDSMDPSLLRSILLSLAQAGLKIGEHFVVAAGARTARDILKAVGIAKPGTYTTSNGYVIFRDYQMADGAKKMTTRITKENWKKYERPFAIDSAKATKLEYGGVARNLSRVARAIPPVGALTEGVFAGFEEYNTYPFLPEGERLSNALVEGAVVFAGSLVFGEAGSLLGVAIGGGIGMFLGGEPGAVIGAAIGSASGGVFGGVVFDGFNKGVLHYGMPGESIMDELKSNIYEIFPGNKSFWREE